MQLTDTELRALRLARHGVLTSHVPDRTAHDAAGLLLPGRRAFARLVRLGLVFQTEEDPIDVDGEPFWPTPSFTITEAGLAFLASQQTSPNT